VRELKILTIILFVILPFYAQEEGAEKGPEVAVLKTVVIDAGHGGKDSGSLGAKTQEKDIALTIALKVGEYISTYMPGVKVIYTRDSDEFVPLFERADIANKYKADVFISIHCNSVPPKKSHINGTETYVMGLHNAEENLQVAKRENEVVLLEKNYAKNYDGFDPNSPEAHIMLSMYQNAYIGQSILLAEKVESQFKDRAKRASRGVKQAGFVVLRATSMPSVLIETGFLSNTTEEAYLNSEKGQVYIASAIYRAFKEYRSVVEKIPYDDPSQNISHNTSSDPETNVGVAYRVQIASSPTKLNTKSSPWNVVTELDEVYVAGAYKYVVGNFDSMAEAAKMQSHWRGKGFNDAFIVAFHGNERISLAKAKAVLGK
jgi:N-acetylmuramoyl-L-alanine amidase